MKKIFVFLFVFVAFSCKGNNQPTNSSKPNPPEVGDKGPGGGIIFRVRGIRAWELSDKLGIGDWENAQTVCKNHRGGDDDTWRLPTREELKWVWQNLLRSGKLVDSEWYWSSEPMAPNGFVTNYVYGRNFGNGKEDNESKFEIKGIRAVRVFKFRAETF